MNTSEFKPKIQHLSIYKPNHERNAQGINEQPNTN